MSDNVISIPRAPNKIWICDCGCASFYLLEGGEAECAMCNGSVSADVGGWKEYGPEKRSDVETPVIDIQGNGSVEFAKRRVSTISSDPDAAILVVVKESGSVTAWSIADSENQIEWVSEQLDVAKDIIAKNISHKGKADAR